MIWLLAWRNLKGHPLQHSLTVLVAALASGLALASLLSLQIIEDGATRAAQPFDMVIGSKGSSNQLALNTIFLQDIPLANLTYEYFHSIAADKRVDKAVPIGFGDQYEGFRLVGTTPALFDILREQPVSPRLLRLSRGRLFKSSFEVVVGSEVSRKLSLNVGDTFVSEHGIHEAEEGEEHHEHPYKVVGVLHSAETPYDRGIFCSIDSLWEVHGQKNEGRGVTAVIVRTKGLSDLMRIYQEVNNGTDAQAIFPGQVIAGLYKVIGQGNQVLRVFAMVVLLMTALTTAISLYWATVERRQEISVLRALGATKAEILRLTLLQACLVATGGIVLGCLIGFGTAVGLSLYLRESSAVVSWPVLRNEEFLTMAGLMVLSAVAGLIPGLLAYRTEVVSEQRL